jgi:hypothetical protein
LNIAPSVSQQPFNISISGGTVTFSFVGRFFDANNKQTFTVNYTNSSGQPATHDFTFIKIKSLTHFGNGSSSDCSAIKPTPTSINVPLCQTGSVGISFPNISYSNVWENPVVCYGTVSNYEYLLPAGWQLGTTTSNGTTWLPGGNSATITYNAATGDGGFVRIRPVNTACGTNLNKGREIAIPISRPAPVVYISMTKTYLCSTNETTTATINGTPPGASVVWSLPSGTTEAQIVGCNTCQTVTIERTGTQDVALTLTATITDCASTYTRTETINLGFPYSLFPIDGTDFAVPGGQYYFQQDLPYPSPPASYSWQVSSGWQVLSGGNGPIAFIQAGSTGGFIDVAVTACGLTRLNSKYVEIGPGGDDPARVGGGNDFDFTLSPNPAKNTATISITGITNSFEVRVFDLMTSTLVKQQRYDKGQTQVRLQIANLKAGTYVVQITSGSKTKSKQLRVMK